MIYSFFSIRAFNHHFNALTYYTVFKNFHILQIFLSLFFFLDLIDNVHLVTYAKPIKVKHPLDGKKNLKGI